MTLRVLSLFPEMIAGALAHGVVGQAVARGDLALTLVNPRAFGAGVHQAVDDRPFGGGDGMVMTAETIDAALASARVPPGSRVVYPSARGRRFDDRTARAWAQEESLAFVCGRYGGLDQRAIAALDLDEVSIGDYVLSGGELAALAMIDAVARFIPGVLGNAASSGAESFAHGLLEEPQFTRPREWRGLAVPEALLSGDHARIAQWKADLSLLTTLENRPDLVAQAKLDQTLGQKIDRARMASARRRLLALSDGERAACGLKLAPEALLARLAAAESEG